MVETKLLTEYPVEGVEEALLPADGKVVLEYRVSSHPSASEQKAEVFVMIRSDELGWPDAMTDYKDPVVYKDDVLFDYRRDQFMFPPDSEFALRVELQFTKTFKPAGRTVLVQPYVRPYYRPT